MEKKKVGLLPAIASLLVFGYIFLLFKPIITHPNMYLLANGGDGLKNYYTPAWYVKYDHGAHFTGMDYPFGEHVTFTDNQPLLSWTLSILKHVLPIENKTIAIINLLVLLSPVITAFFISLLLLFFEVEGLPNIALAIGLTLLAPQFMRIGGHFALAYSWMFPVYWYLSLRYFKEGGWQKVLMALLLLTAVSFIHLYNLFICMGFTGFFVIPNFIIQKSKKLKVRNIIWLIISLLPFVLYLVFLKVTDTTTDRPPAPWGLLFYTTTLPSVFLPNEFCYLHQLTERWPDLSWHWEGYAYVGIAGVISALVVLIRGSFFVIRRKNLMFEMPYLLSLSIFSAAAVLLVSTGFPFNWPLQNYVEHFSLVRQFRSLGRLSWVFYFVLTVYGAVFFYRLYKYLYVKKPQLSALPIFFVICAWLIDGAVYSYNVQLGSKNISNSLLLKKPAMTDSTFTRYQAIVALPFFCEGSEKFYGDQDMDLTAHALILSYQAHLPLMNGMMSRSSFHHTADLLGLFGNPLLPLPAHLQLSKKPFLLYVHTTAELNNKERSLVNIATFIKHLEPGYDIYVLSADAFVKLHATVADSAKACLNNMQLKNRANENIKLIIGPKTNADELFDSTLVFGTAGKYSAFDDTLPQSWDNKKLTVSWWLKVYEKDEGFPIGWLEYNSLDGKQNFWRQDIATKMSRDYVAGWVRISYPITYHKGVRLKISAEGKHVKINGIWIQTEGSHRAINDSHGRLWYDNFPIQD